MDKYLFLGQHEHALDDKKRVVLPKDYRPRFENGIVIRAGEERCLVAYPFDEWMKELERFKTLPETKKATREYKRWFFGKAVQAKPDGQGRVLVPADLQRYAGLKKKLVVVGVFDKLEIWDKDTWDEREPMAEDAIEEISEGLE